MISIPLLAGFCNGKRNTSQSLGLTDAVDKLHFVYTVAMLAVFGVMAGCKQFLGSPIDCFIGAENTKVKGWEEFILTFCYVQSTSSYDLDATNQTAQGSISYSYYQYVPLFLGFQALCFLLPHLIWDWLQSLLYIDMSVIVTEVRKISQQTDITKQEKMISHVSQHIFNYFNYRRSTRRTVFACFLNRSHTCTAFYVFTKLLKLINVFLQFCITNVFLGSDWLWSFRTVSQIMGFSESTTSVQSSQFFPLVVQCTYPLPAGLKINIHTSQCLLAVNYLNEKLFLISLIWFAMLFCITVANIFGLCSELTNSRRNQDIRKFVNLQTNDAHFCKLGDFWSSFLSADGALLIKFVKAEAGKVATGSIVSKVFEKYCEEKGFGLIAQAFGTCSNQNTYTALPTDGAGDSGFLRSTDH